MNSRSHTFPTAQTPREAAGLGRVAKQYFLVRSGVPAGNPNRSFMKIKPVVCRNPKFQFLQAIMTNGEQQTYRLDIFWAMWRSSLRSACPGVPEFEPLIDNHIKMPRVIAAPEIINRACTSIQTADTLRAFCRLDTLGSCHHLESPVWSAITGRMEPSRVSDLFHCG
jgi:hypothetical protein